MAILSLVVGFFCGKLEVYGLWFNVLTGLELKKDIGLGGFDFLI